MSIINLGNNVFRPLNNTNIWSSVLLFALVLFFVVSFSVRSELIVVRRVHDNVIVTIENDVFLAPWGADVEPLKAYEIRYLRLPFLPKIVLSVDFFNNPDLFSI